MTLPDASGNGTVSLSTPVLPLILPAMSGFCPLVDDGPWEADDIRVRKGHSYNGTLDRTAVSHYSRPVSTITTWTVSGSPNSTCESNAARRGSPTCRTSRSFSTTTELSKPTLAQAFIRCCPEEQWVPEAQVVNCMAPDCATSFSLFNRKYHCRMCGLVFCSSCCSIPVTTTHQALTGATLHRVESRTRSFSVQGLVTDREMPTASSNWNVCVAAGVASRHLIPSIPSFEETLEGVDARTLACSDACLSSNGAGQINDALGAGVRPAPAPATSGPTTGLDSVAPQLVSNSGGVSSRAAPSKTCAFTVCSSCHYETQLVISMRQDNGEVRRRCRGELKMLQRAVLVNVLSFLPLVHLMEVALVSSDFYFLSRDNVIWYQYNMARWWRAPEPLQLPNVRYTGWGDSRRRNDPEKVQTDAVLQDATALSKSDAARRAISLHARYNYTQFLDFTRRQEMVRCKGLASLSIGVRMLFSNPIKIAVIGPCGVNKTACVRRFLGENPMESDAYPTMGFVRYEKKVRVVGAITAEVDMQIYDVSGAPRYESLRRLLCANCHAVGLCYDATRKVTLVQAADIMLGVEPALGPQPAVVCGLVCDGNKGPMGSTSTFPSPRRRAGGSMPAPLYMSPLQDINDSDASSLPLNGMGGAAPRHWAVHRSFSAVQTDPPPATEIPSTAFSSVEVSADEAAGITVRGHGSLLCRVSHAENFFQMLLQSLMTRLGAATVTGTTGLPNMYEVPTDAGRGSGHTSEVLRCMAASPRPQACQAMAQELLNLSMQPSVVDILLDAP